MHKKKIFISGGAGVIGSALVEKLIEAGAEIFVGDLKPCPKEWVGKVKYWQGDLNFITKRELLDFNPEVFFHLAATFERSEETYAFMEENFHHNVKLSHHLMHILKDANDLKKVVFASSYLIYDPLLYLSTQPHPPVVMNENTFIYPRNICGAAKLFHELELRFLESFLKEQVQILSARIFRVYGRGSKDIISRWVRAALHDEELSVYRSEGQFDYIFADDVAEGLIKLAETSFSGVVNLGMGQARSIKAVIEILKGHFPNLKWKELESHIPFEGSEADMRLFKEKTQWHPTHTLELAIPKIIQFEKENKSIKPTPSESYEGVMITSISKKIPLLKAIRDAANKLAHFKTVYGCDSDENCVGQYCVDEFWPAQSLEHLQFEDVLTYCQDHQIKAIIPTRDADLQFYSKYAEGFRQKGIEVLVSNPEVIESCLDKKKFADALMCHDLPVIPAFLILEEIKAEHYVVKERFGAGSHRIGLKLNKDDAKMHARQLNDPIFQPYIEGVEWSVDLYRSKHGKVMGTVARKRDYVVNGESQITTTAFHPVLEKLCETVAITLNIYGHAVLQVIEDGEGDFHIIECNPRFGGASTASLAVGLDSFYWFFLECMGQNIEENPFVRSSEQVRQVRYPADWILPWS